MDEKNKNTGLDCNFYVCYDICVLHSTNHEQPSGSKREFYPALGSSHQLQSLGLLWTFQERDIPLAAANAPGIIFGLVTAITALI